MHVRFDSVASLVATTIAGLALVTSGCVGDSPVTTPTDSGTPDTGTGPDAGTDAADAAPDVATCTSGLTACGGTCVNTDSDTANCGRCGHDCVGGACDTGVCQPVTVVAGAGSILNTPPMGTDGTNVCWAIDSSNAVDRAIYCVPSNAKSGATPITVASNIGHPDAIAVAANKVFWDTGSSGSVTLWSGDPTTASSQKQLNPVLTPPGGDWYDLQHLVANSTGTHLFASLEDSTAASTYFMLVVDVDINAQTRTTIRSTTPTAGGGASLAQRSRGMSTDDKGIYVSYNSSANAGIVERFPVGGGAATTFSSTEVYPYGAFVDSGYVYWWAGNGPFAIRRAQIVASPNPSDVVAVSGNVVRMVATPTHVLWTQGQNTDILMAPASGGGAASSYVKGTLGDKPSALVRDAVALYWIDQADGSLHRVALP